MITGKINELPLYFSLHPALEYIHKFMVEYKENPKPEGSYVILPERVKANIFSYSTVSPEGRNLEAHKKNCDIQILLEGKEYIECAPLSDCKDQISEEYSSGGDIAFYKDPESVSRVLLESGSFVLFRPEDAHKPCLCVNGKKETVKKIVFKFVIG